MSESQATGNNPDHGAAVGGEKKKSHRAGLFDIRTFIAMLLGFYGIVLLLMGLFGTSDTDVSHAAGINVNLWVGIGNLVAAAVFEGWRRWRPVRVPDDLEAAEAHADARRGH